MDTLQIFGTTYSDTSGIIVSNTSNNEVLYVNTFDADATSSDIINGKTAYINGNKIIGTITLQTYYTGSSAPDSSFGTDGDIYLQTSS